MSDTFDHSQDAYDSRERDYQGIFHGIPLGKYYYVSSKSKHLNIGEVLTETEKAILFSTIDGSGKFWVPKSMMIGRTVNTVKVYKNFVQEILPVEELGKSYIKKIKTCVNNNVQVYSLADVKYLLETIEALDEELRELLNL